VAPLATPQAAPPTLAGVSAGYVSPDVIDLRNQTHHPLMDKISGLVQAVKDDYHDSFPAPMPPQTPYGPVIPKLVR